MARRVIVVVLALAALLSLSSTSEACGLFYGCHACRIQRLQYRLQWHQQMLGLSQRAPSNGGGGGQDEDTEAPDPTVPPVPEPPVAPTTNRNLRNEVFVAARDPLDFTALEDLIRDLPSLKAMDQKIGKLATKEDLQAMKQEILDALRNPPADVPVPPAPQADAPATNN